jgi:hypothetical protein
MSIARHHNEWLSLIEVSGPFLSLPVLLRVFPQGLDALDREGMAELRSAYDEWLDNQNSLRPEPAIHSVWSRYVLVHVLAFEKTTLLEGPAIPQTLNVFVAEQGETLRPDLIIVPNDSSDQKPRMLVQIYPVSQGLEKSMHDRRWKASPAMRMLELLRDTGVQLGLVTNGEQWMLVNAPKGETSAFISWYAGLWLEEPLTLRAFTSLLGAPRFFSVAEADTLEGMLRDSVNEQQEVTDQLGYQVRRAVEVLIRAIDKADQDHGRELLKDIHESDLYEAALTVMMRLVFLFSAEERGLLLLGDPIYDQNYAVSTLRAQLRETADQQGEEVLERRFDAWWRLLATFRAVHDGIHHDRLNLPAYGGSLFDPDRYPFLEGKVTDLVESEDGEAGHGSLRISNRTVLHLLEALQILRVKVPGGGPAEARRLSFRALDVEQIGHVYEGLLDHIAVRTTELVLGLAGTRDKEPEISLSTLLAESAKGEKSFLAFLKEQTGRSENALKNGLKEKPDAFTCQHLQIACNNDEKMFEQVVKFAGLVRGDDFGYPTIFLPGSVYLTAGATRRATGTHYTPRSLTEPIVQHTLELLVYTGPAEGLPKEEWKLKSPTELLELKVCDMAMGSAGFLVQVIRYLSVRLVEAWENLTEVSLGGIGGIKFTPEGKPATGKPNELIIPKDDEERLILARRLVADRCIYGVDKNPLAVEIAKLSIWLTTMDKGRPFTFLDHALKCGDSLVGADEDMYRKWAYSLKGAQFTLYLTTLEEFTTTARQKRKELESFTVLDARDAEHKAELLNEADAAMARVKLGCDLLVGVRLLGLKPAEQEILLSHFLWDYVAGLPMDTPDAARALNAAQKEYAFHWEFEFPEVFIAPTGGFSAFVGNPPFVGGRNITEHYGRAYNNGLVSYFVSPGKSADLSSYFLIRMQQHLQPHGYAGLISPESISVGVTRENGLEKLVSLGGKIYIAETGVRWPGEPNRKVNLLWISKIALPSKKKAILNGKEVPEISPDLRGVISFTYSPARLSENIGVCFQGITVNGESFILDQVTHDDFCRRDPRCEKVLLPYITGEDLNRSISPISEKYVINFSGFSEEQAKKYELLYLYLSSTVKSMRQSITSRKDVREKWWAIQRLAPNLQQAISNKKHVMCRTRYGNWNAIAIVDSFYVFSDGIIVFAFDDWASFSILQSDAQSIWAFHHGSPRAGSLRYKVKTCFESFPFPKNLDGLDKIGETYHEHRQEIMLQRQEGLTTTYNRFHNPKEKSANIAHLRELHVELDKAVAAAYVWRDLDLGHDFHETPQGVRFTISELARREVLSRLLQLNHERYEEEVRQGLHEKDKKKAKEEKPERQKPKKLTQPEGQMNLLAEPEVPDEVEAAESLSSTSTAKIGSWDRCKCMACGKTLMGFSITEHTQSEHQGKDPGYRKMGG